MRCPQRVCVNYLAMVRVQSEDCTSVQSASVEDIEDVILRGDADQISRLVSSPNVTIRVKKHQMPAKQCLADVQFDSFVPG